MPRRQTPLSAALPSMPSPAPNPDAAVMQGGPKHGEIYSETPAAAPGTEPSPPVAAASSAQPSPETVPVRIGDLEVRLPADQAAQISAAYEQQRTRAEAYEQIARERPAYTPNPVPERETPAPPRPQYGARLFTDPDAVLEEVRSRAIEEARASFKPTLDKIEAFERQQKIDGFFNDFYARNADLKGSDLVVRAVAQRDVDGLARMGPQAAMDELARRARSEILSLMKAHRPETPAAPQRTVVEGASPVAPRPAPAQPEPPASLTAAITARRARRRQGAARLQ